MFTTGAGEGVPLNQSGGTVCKGNEGVHGKVRIVLLVLQVAILDDMGFAKKREGKCVAT